MQTTNLGFLARRIRFPDQEPFDLEFLFSDAMGFIPVNLSLENCTIGQAHRGNALPFAPATLPIDFLQAGSSRIARPLAIVSLCLISPRILNPAMLGHLGALGRCTDVAYLKTSRAPRSAPMVSRIVSASRPARSSLRCPCAMWSRWK